MQGDEGRSSRRGFLRTLVPFAAGSLAAEGLRAQPVGHAVPSGARQARATGRTVVGSGGDYDPADYGGDAALAIRAAVAAGRRWLVFVDRINRMGTPLDLGEFGELDLALEGAGARDGTSLWNGQRDGPMLHSSSPMRLSLNGLTFYGNAADWPSTHPLLQLDHLYLSRIAGCWFHGGAGDAIVLGRESLQAVWIEHCHVHDMGGSGIRLLNYGDIHVRGGSIERCEGVGIDARGPDNQARGLGSIEGVHLEYNRQGNIRLSRVRLVAIERCFVMGNDIVLERGVEECALSGNLLFEARIRDLGADNEVRRNLRVAGW